MKQYGDSHILYRTMVPGKIYSAGIKRQTALGREQCHNDVVGEYGATEERVI